MAKMTAIEPMEPKQLAASVRAALDEDQVWNDATLEYLEVPSRTANAEIVVKRAGVLSGMEVAREVFRQVDDSVVFDAAIADGGNVSSPMTIATISGQAASILRAERVALNFLQRMSGIATLSRRFVDAVDGTGVTILDTRKTSPLLRDFQKYAVRCGGARNHRRDLGAMVLVKENHRRALGGRQALLETIRRRGNVDSLIEVEVDSLDFLDELLGAPIDRVMLDNFSLEQLDQALERIAEFRAEHPENKFEVEVSGGITLDLVSSYARPGVDYISVGTLTHSARSLDISLGFV